MALSIWVVEFMKDEKRCRSVMDSHFGTKDCWHKLELLPQLSSDSVDNKSYEKILRSKIHRNESEEIILFLYIIFDHDSQVLRTPFVK